MIDNAIVFDARIAEKYSLEEAIVIAKLYGWIKHNATNGMNFHDGRYWTFNSLSAFAKYFPFWSESKVKRILIDLYGGIDKKDAKPKHEQILLKGRYNKSSFDRTVWYSFTDEFFEYLRALGYELKAEVPFSASDQMGVPPADEQYQLNNQYKKKKETKKDKSFLSKKDFDFFASLLGIGIEEQIAKDWMKIRASKKASDSETAFKQLQTAIRSIQSQNGITANDIIKICVTNGWYGCKASYFLNIRLDDYDLMPSGTQNDLFSSSNETSKEAVSPWGVKYQ